LGIKADGILKNVINFVIRDWGIMKKPRVRKNNLLPFNKIQISIPKRFLLKCYYKNGFLTQKETIKTYTKLRELEDFFCQVRHIISIVEKIQLKGWKNVKYKERNLTQGR